MQQLSRGVNRLCTNAIRVHEQLTVLSEHDPCPYHDSLGTLE